MDLTVAAVPAFFGSMAWERRALSRRAQRNGPSPVDYERRDTIASLTMGTASLVVPLLTRAVADRIAPQRSRVGRGLLGVAVAAGGLTVAADAVRSRGGRSAPATERAERVAAVAGPIAVVAGGVAACAAWATALRPARMWSRPHLADRGAGALATLAAVAGWDLIYYWNHRLMHEVRYLWAIHVVHHSSERYNLSTALRQPVADSLGAFVPYGLLCSLGLSPELVERARGINLLYQYWIHTDTIRRIGVLEEVLNTPSHHRVHHGVNREYIDRNHGSILIAWDRVFGTFQREVEPVRYGLTRNIDTFDPWRIATHEYRDLLADVAGATSWPDRLSYLLRGPGWAYQRRAALAAAS